MCERDLMCKGENVDISQKLLLTFVSQLWIWEIWEKSNMKRALNAFGCFLLCTAYVVLYHSGSKTEESDAEHR